ncbi:hypothetical protein [Spirosoma flavum]|uniref:Uncharacterized protein n=1 Tax=Spirosoma flavum TaxID=2048557 RepID=A0ABW6AQ81_9BACT
MTSDSLTELYRWARNHIGQPLMLDYELYKVNGQTAGSLFLLLRQHGSLRPDVEIQIEYTPDRPLFYQVDFRLLPVTSRLPCPERLHVNLANQPEVIQWLLTGNKRISSSASSEAGDSQNSFLI